jgi:hypothetical protein
MKNIRRDLSAVAPKSGNPSRSLLSAINNLDKYGVKKVCEVGCGLLANTEHLLKAFPYVILTDRKEILPRISDKLSELKGKYRSFRGFVEHNQADGRISDLDGAIVINVLHILPSKRERYELLRTVKNMLITDGLAFFDVPRNETYYRDQVKTAIPYQDGFCMSRGRYFTFYKNMNSKELSEMITRVGFHIEAPVFIDHRITFLARKSKE